MDREHSPINYQKHSPARASSTVEIERQDTLNQLLSILKRAQCYHFILIGEQGSGRTSCLNQLKHKLNSAQNIHSYQWRHYDLGSIALKHEQQALQFLQDQLSDIHHSNQTHMICLDEVERFYHYLPSMWSQFIDWLITTSQTTPHHFGLCLTPDLYYRYLAHDALLTRYFEALTLPSPTPDELIQLIEDYLTQHTQEWSIQWSQNTINHLIELSRHYLNESLPAAALKLADQVIGFIKCSTTARANRILDKSVINQVMTSYYGIQPLATPGLRPERLLNLAQQLNEQITGHKYSLYQLQQALFNQQLPISQTRQTTSIILIGPAHVGKTTTARLLTRQLFGNHAQYILINLEHTSPYQLMRIFDRELQKPLIASFIMTQLDKASNEVLIYLQQILQQGIVYNEYSQPRALNHHLLLFIYQQPCSADNQQTQQSPQTDAASQQLQLVLNTMPDTQPNPGASTQDSQTIFDHLDLPDPLVELSQFIYFDELTVSDREMILQKTCQQLAQRAMISYGAILQFEDRFAYRFLKQHQMQYSHPLIIQKHLQGHLHHLLNQYFGPTPSHQWQELLIQMDQEGQLTATSSQQRLL